MFWKVVSNRPQKISSTGADTIEKIVPTVASTAAQPIIICLRSIRSPIAKPMIGPSGAASAITTV
jgi:hypothetical protein